ncbi:Xaa-Pro peptidase family protein [Pseudoalteromonas sp. Of7M-16]|uniref:M24 family metallopeptidase n=1 Tax=Pseudoalteromonas sp. Of7M-16 TaxID=2917756 RepID=UPI001EF6975A|nr:Xaa-Pro peptidase family protein [Pseudoalteromonas sp. Of7M-16]MCG7549285.1 Xaa-Pro peptidase family protein [Pseudoalteromonas sp. Of7M-16]
MKANHNSRRQQLIAKLSQHDIDMMVVSGHENIQYLSGFSGNAATLLISKSNTYLITDYRYYERACLETENIHVIKRDRDAQRLGQCILALFPELNKIAYESENVSVAQWEAIAADLTYPYVQGAYGWVEALREVKDDIEIAFLQQAANIADAALCETLTLVREGVKERDLALELEYKMRQKGSQGVSFDTILLFGERSALPHGDPSERALRHGDLILIDFGAVVGGYRSDMTRTYIYGTPSAQQQAMFNTVQRAQHAALEKVQQGVSCDALNQVAHRVLNNSEFAQFAGEGLGHGLGLALHEHPFIKPNNPYVLSAGNVITIEPGIYIPHVGGVRLEEDIVVTPNGYQQLTHSAQNFEL